MMPPIEPSAPERTDDEAPSHLRLVHDAGAAELQRPGRVTLPHNLEAEESVIGSILFSGKCLKSVIELLTPQDFHHPSLGAVYAAFLDLYEAGRPIDIITTAEQMRATETIGKIRAQGGEAYLAELSSKVATVENIAHHAGIVREKSIARRLYLQAAAVRDHALLPGQNVAELADRAHKMIAELARSAAPPAPPMFEPGAYLLHAKASLSKPLPPKLPFGLKALDEQMNGGVPAGAVVVLVAPPKFFKTALLMELMIRWARAGERVVYVTGENSAKEIYARLSAHEQFGQTNKFHSTIKHETEAHQVEANLKAIEWMAGRVRVVSLPDEEMAEPRGPNWLEVLAQCGREHPAPLVIVDYVEEFADRLPRSIAGDTPQAANKAVLQKLKRYALQHQARVLAVCSVGRGTYAGAEAVFTNPEARPEDFRSVAKHSGYIEYAASAVLALQMAGDPMEDEDGHPCTPMRMHLAFAREGKGPATVGIRAYGGSCRFVEDETAAAIMEDEGPQLPGLQGKIMRELAKPEHAAGANGDVIARLVQRRVKDVKATLKAMAQQGTINQLMSGRAVLFRHPRFGPTQEPLRLDGEGEGGLPN